MAQSRSDSKGSAQSVGEEKAKSKAATTESIKKARPVKSLPTERISFSKQLDILRAFAAASGPSGKPVSNKDVAGIVKMSDATVSLANAFFVETGLLQRSDGGFLPSPEVLSFQRTYEWSPETASHKLGPVISATWFATALLPKVTYGPVEYKDAVTTLAESASAGPEYENNLATLLSYMEAAALIQRDGNLVKQVKQAAATPAVPDRAAANQPIAEQRDPAASKTSVSTAFAQPTEGTIQFHVSVRVDMAEFSGWKPERIAAFFGGIAQVLAAKGEIEKLAGN